MPSVHTEIVNGRLKVHVELGEKGGPGSGDKPGHPFRGNQWEGGSGGAEGSGRKRGSFKEESNWAKEHGVQVLPTTTKGAVDVISAGVQSYCS